MIPIKSSTIVLAVFLILSCAACTPRSGNSSSEQDTPKSLTQAPLEGSQAPSGATSTPQEAQTAQADAESGAQREIAQPDGSSAAVLSIVDQSGKEREVAVYLPEKWTAEGSTILEDGRLVAEFHSLVQIESPDAYLSKIDAEQLKSEYGGELHTAGMDGRYYGYQTEIQEGGVTAKHNELRYYVCVGNKAALVTFYPAFGIGIGTQREEFERFLVTLDL